MSFLEVGCPSPKMLRIALWGPHKSGKTVFCSTFPKPVFIHSSVEGGYDTFLQEGKLLFPVFVVGESHANWIVDRKGTKISDELYLLIRKLHEACPYQTVVIGGFSDILALLKTEADELIKDDIQRQWGYVSSWTSKFLASLFSLPVHIIVESAAATRRKNRLGNVVSMKPDIPGKTENLLMNKANLILFQEVLDRGVFQTHFSQVMRADSETRKTCEYAFATSRLRELSIGPQQNCCYDVIAEVLGLPGLHEVDPQHPRCQPGVWQWPHPHM